MKECVLHKDKICDDCGECDIYCQYDPSKICDNCFKCLEEDLPDYGGILIEEIITDLDGNPSDYPKKS